MKVKVFESDYVTLEKDAVKNRIYVTLSGYWDSTPQIDRNLYNKVLSHMMSLKNQFGQVVGQAGRFTIVVDLSSYDPSGSPTFAQLFERVGVRIGEMGVTSHAQVLPPEFFTLNGIEPPIEFEQDDDTGKPSYWTTSADDAEQWLQAHM